MVFAAVSMATIAPWNGIFWGFGAVVVSAPCSGDKLISMKPSRAMIAGEYIDNFIED